MEKKHCVAIFGGAVAGSEAVEQMIKRGIDVVVFEQNALPYGKIESGLPKWHVKLRDKQERKIDERLNQPRVRYVPLCSLGRDIDFTELATKWGFSAILLATGAWKDRPFPVKKIETFMEKGFYYQNPFVQWFNWFHDPNYSGVKYSVKEGAIVIGGGLASIDVAKILMIETFKAAVKRLGHKLDSISIERLGLKKAAEKLGISLGQLNLKSCKIVYRRRIIDMPLSPDPIKPGASEMEKCHSVRKKIVRLAEDKYLFKVLECLGPKDILVENGVFTGLVMQKNKIENDRAIAIEGETIELKSPLVISSIGSIPEAIPGINSDGEKFEIEDLSGGKLKGFKNVFILGNAITGKGNIKESQKHGRNVSELIIRDYLGLEQGEIHKSDYEFKTDIEEQLKPVATFISQSEPINEDDLKNIWMKVKALQKSVGFSSYDEWIKKNLPLREENMDIISE